MTYRRHTGARFTSAMKRGRWMIGNDGRILVKYRSYLTKFQTSAYIGSAFEVISAYRSSMISCGGQGSSKSNPIISHEKSSSPAFAYAGLFVKKARGPGEIGSGPGEMDSGKLIGTLSVVPSWSPPFGKVCCVLGTWAGVESRRDVSLFRSFDSWFLNNVSTCSVSKTIQINGFPWYVHTYAVEPLAVSRILSLVRFSSAPRRRHNRVIDACRSRRSV